MPDAGAVYDQIGRSYTRTRTADPRIARFIDDALGSARRVVNVGAGTGSYEPADRDVVAVEPSLTMLAQRPRSSAPAVRARAEQLPFADRCFDIAMAVLTVHHWADLASGLAELGRVADRQAVFMFDRRVAHDFWLIADYLPDLRDLPTEATAPTPDDLRDHLEVRDVRIVPLPADCLDGMGAAHWNRPDRYLDPLVLAGMSHTSRLDPAVLAAGLERLRTDLADGTWDRRHGHLRALSDFDAGYRLVVAGSPTLDAEADG